jgi:cation diffusion facilitator family transporter|tara:strand:+ start:359 stop:1756 length:1398 start_codon:yes stop_codon:yes gene_type:complete
MLDDVAQKAKKRAATLSITSATVLTAIKIALALATNSLAILALAIDSILDIAGSVTAYFSVLISGRPPDSEHRYGHGKIENIGGLLITGIIIITVGFLAYESINRLLFISTNISVGFVGIIGILFSISIEIGISWHLMRIAIRHNSQVLEANSLQFRMDIWTQSIVVIGLILVNMGYDAADSIIAILISVYIAYLGIKMGAKSIDVLLDRVPIDLVKKIEIAVEGTEGVVKYENLRVRTSGPQTFVDMRIHVPRIFSLEKAHNIASEVEGRVKSAVSDVDVLVHVEAEEGNEKMIDKIRLIATEISGIKGIHDLWVRQAENSIEIDAHIEVDSEAPLSKAHNIASQLENRLKKEFIEDSVITIHIDTEVDRVIYRKSENVRIPGLRKMIENILVSIDEVKSFGPINVKRFNKELHVSITCTLNKDLKVRDAHKVSEQIETKIISSEKNVTKVFVHTEPPTENEKH